MASRKPGPLHIVLGLLLAVDAHGTWHPSFHHGFDHYLMERAERQTAVVQA